MKIGFIGPRMGMTCEQYVAVAKLLERYRPRQPVGLHGDSMGADEEFDELCRLLRLKTECRPCRYELPRANTGAVEAAKPVALVTRNKAIVRESDVVIACPPGFEPVKGGTGSWSAIRYARRSATPVIIVYPDGTADSDNLAGLPLEVEP